MRRPGSRCESCYREDVPMGRRGRLCLDCIYRMDMEADLHLMENGQYWKWHDPIRALERVENRKKPAGGDHQGEPL